MVVHIVLAQPKNGQRQQSPLIGACGKTVGGLYTRSRNPSSRVCPDCLAIVAKRVAEKPDQAGAGERPEEDPGRA
jgi:hypothetical protein